MKNEFHRNGFVTLKQCEQWLNVHWVILYQFKRIFEGDIPNELPSSLCWNIGNLQRIQKIDRVHLLSDIINNIVRSQELICEVQRVTNTMKIQLYSTYLFYKPSGSGQQGNIGWHTDTKNISNKKLNTVVICIPLSNIYKNSGIMKVLKGSHLWSDNTEHSFNDGTKTELQQQSRALKKIAPMDYHWEELYAYENEQEYSIHNGNVWHCSGPNESKESRLTLSVSLHIQNDMNKYLLPDVKSHPILFDSTTS